MDIDLHQPTRTLVAATYGRSMYSFHLDQLVSSGDLDVSIRELRIYPNPATDRLTLIYPTIKQGIIAFIYNSEGKQIRELHLIPGQDIHQIDLNGLSPGIYYVFMDDKQNPATGKFIVK